MHSRSAIPASRHWLFWSLAVLGLAADLASKHWMFTRPDLLAGEARWVWPHYVGFQLSLNEGALFGMGQGNVWLFAACSVAAAVAIPAWLFVYGGAHDRAVTAVLGGILGGVLGNLYDRVGLPGLEWSDFAPQREGAVYAVRDFILVAWRWDEQWQNRVVWPNFNVADALLVGGAMGLMLLSFRPPRADAPSDMSTLPTGSSPTK